MGCTTRDKSIRNKRRLRSIPPSIPVKIEENLCDDRRNGVVLEPSSVASKPIRLLEGGGGFAGEKPKEREKDSEEQPEEVDWGYCIEDQLEDLLLKNLEYVYKEAICKITTLGYTIEESLKGMLQNGHCYGSSDVLSNIVNNSLAYLNSGCSDCFDDSDIAFRELKQLEQYVLTGLVCLLRQVRPQLSKGDAMWCLLMSDLNVGQESTLEIPVLPPGDEKMMIKPNGNGSSPSTVISMPSPIRPSCSSSSFVPVTATSEPCRMCAKTKKTSGLNLAQDGTADVDTSSSAQKGFTFDAGTSHAPSTTTTHFKNIEHGER